MDKKEEFKSFINNHPELTEYIKKKEMTMQSFYELYDVYGEKEEVWDKYFKESKNTDITDLLRKLNIDNLEKQVNNAQKVIEILKELAKKSPENDVVSKIPVTKFFGD